MNRKDSLRETSNFAPDSSHTAKEQPKRIGTILREADLVSTHQLNLALGDRANFPDLRLGEILAMRGWIEPKTADFFVEDWSKIVTTENRQPIGHYLVQSGLLIPQQVEIILEQQKSTGIRFGTIAVMQGFLKSTTLDFFLNHLYPQESEVSPFATMYGTLPLQTSSSAEDELSPIIFEDWDDEVLWQEYLKESEK